MAEVRVKPSHLVPFYSRGPRRPTPFSQTWKRPTFCHRSGIDIFCPLFATYKRPDEFISDAWPASATYHRSFCEQCERRVGCSPYRAHPVQISWRSRCFFRSTSVEDSESRRFELTLGSVFFRADLGPRSAHELVISWFLKMLELFATTCAHSERCRHILVGIFEILTFYGNMAFLMSPVLVNRCQTISLLCIYTMVVSYHGRASTKVLYLTQTRTWNR